MLAIICVVCAVLNCGTAVHSGVMARNAQFYFKPITFLLCAALELKRETNCRTRFLLDILANPRPWSMLHGSPLRAPETSMGIGLVVCWFSTTRSRWELRGHTHFRKDEIAARSRSTTNIWNMAGRINWWSIFSSPYVLYGYRLCTAESDLGRKARGPVVMPSAELDAHLHSKAAEIAESRHNKQRYSPLLIL